MKYSTMETVNRAGFWEGVKKLTFYRHVQKGVRGSTLVRKIWKKYVCFVLRLKGRRILVKYT